MTASQAVDTSSILVFRKICVEMYKMIQFKKETCLKSFSKTGLKTDSVIKTGKLATLDKKIILGEIGEISADTEKEINKKIKILFGNYTGDIKSNLDEVSEYKWINFEQLKKEINDTSSSPWLKIAFQKYLEYFNNKLK